MANHKRRRPRHQRAGCIQCKPWKDDRGKNSEAKQSPSVRRQLQDSFVDTWTDVDQVPYWRLCDNE